MGKIGMLFIAALLGSFVKFLKETAPGALEEEKGKIYAFTGAK